MKRLAILFVALAACAESPETIAAGPDPATSVASSTTGGTTSAGSTTGGAGGDAPAEQDDVATVECSEDGFARRDYPGKTLADLSKLRVVATRRTSLIGFKHEQSLAMIRDGHAAVSCGGGIWTEVLFTLPAGP